MFDTRLRKNLDIPLLVLTYLVAALGVLVIYSATHGDATPYHVRQIVWIALGTVGLAGASALDYHLYNRVSALLYMFNLLALVVVMKFGHATNGAVRWIKIGPFPFQPSEFAKLFVILTLGVYLVKRHDTIHSPRTLILSFLYIAIPMALIFKQPDLGTALVVMSIWFGMVFMAGAKLKHLAAFMVAGALLLATMWHVGLIKQYQKNRLDTWLHADDHAGTTGYQVVQGRIAIGSGEVWGKGFLKGTLVHGGFIPEKQTDFIFTDVGEEFGFVGAITVIGLYALLILRGAMIIAASDEDLLGKVMASGVVTMLAFHVILNIGMNIGIMPIAGVPLPLISAGGSNVILTLTSIGLLESINLHRHQLLF